MILTGIVVILDPEGRALIQHRTGTAPWMPGWWDLPGGSAEPGESVSDAARREAQEEAGVSLSRVTPLGSFGDGIYAFFSQQIQRPSTHLSPNPDGILEHDAHVWVGPDDVSSYKILPVALKAIQAAWQKSMSWRIAKRWIGGRVANVSDIRLTIFSREEAEKALRGPHPFTHLISIGDPERTEPVEGFKNVPFRLALFFHDVSRPWQNYEHPKEEHVKQILQFAKRL